MKKTARHLLPLSIATVLLLPMSIASANYSTTQMISITNISNTVLTPPIVALCKNKIEPIAKVGSSASVALEALAEGGDTSMLANLFAGQNCHYASASAPVLPGETVTLEVSGKKRDYLHMASMLLPTNDGFIFTSGHKVRKIQRKGNLKLTSYDAGTEFNDELCAHIPGPQCEIINGGVGGEGFNVAREANNFVKPHPGLQGGADVSTSLYNWGEPVAYISIQ